MMTKKLTELEKLLYRKKSCEKLMSIWHTGIKAYSVFLDEQNKIIDSESKSKIEKSTARVIIYDNELKLNNFITQYKLTKRELVHYLLPKIEEIATEEEKEKISFDEDYAEPSLRQNTYFQKCKQNPANIELAEVNKLLFDHIVVLEAYREEIIKQLKNPLNDYQYAELNKKLFDVELNIMSNEKRLNDRMDYYHEQFLPKFNSDMKEARKLMPKYLAKAKSIIELNIDFKLKYLLEEYDKYKDDEEQLWLFYTALRARVQSVQKELKENTILVDSGDKKIKAIVEPI
jgi:hypothetical protein